MWKQSDPSILTSSVNCVIFCFVIQNAWKLFRLKSIWKRSWWYFSCDADFWVETTPKGRVSRVAPLPCFTDTLHRWWYRRKVCPSWQTFHRQKGSALCAQSDRTKLPAHPADSAEQAGWPLAQGDWRAPRGAQTPLLPPVLNGACKKGGHRGRWF